ncbi:nuclear transport factor 2 family protein [Mycobacterium branderi]|uniref:SnoaL-like domain-containing protein n=1 Tax=Mycobacterium branderi TaxID=43348 RepID=A0A7I7WBL2_9MYCO|nr:nuclear transport factor 2 family protein [Mycobacterium branderi]MCV7235219.1 nuclear transport factor 2 family protein [Mycobacterium branderi]ORA31864.1 hypothetical protein BST20_26085 [Mycobacterium branderi]BBZ14989.1 hypothetical protein MBRA_51840 [Mycobacterium branderi]
MTLTYQQQWVLDAVAARAAILDLTARHNRCYSAGDLPGWLSTFRHAGASYVCGSQTFTDLRAAFDGGDGKRLITTDHEICVDGVEATQRCVALLISGARLQATGIYDDRLIYERGGWYFAARELAWDLVPREAAVLA